MKAAKVFLKEEVGFQCENPLVKICDRPMPHRFDLFVHLNILFYNPAITNWQIKIVINRCSKQPRSSAYVCCWGGGGADIFKFFI